MNGVIDRQRQWSTGQFGEGYFTGAITDHIRKELIEIEENPGELEEWVDVILLALDGAWRTGADAEQIISALHSKLTVNENRTWPENFSENRAIEHVK